MDVTYFRLGISFIKDCKYMMVSVVTVMVSVVTDTILSFFCYFMNETVKTKLYYNYILPGYNKFLEMVAYFPNKHTP